MTNRYPTGAEQTEARFAPLQPWQKSSKLFDFDPAFVAFVQRHLQTVLKLDNPPELYRAKQYINGWRYDHKRTDDLTLLWEEYQTAQAAPPPPPQPVFPDSPTPSLPHSPTPPPTADDTAERNKVREMLKAKGLISS